MAKMTVERIREAEETRKAYRREKSTLETKIIKNEEWYKRRHNQFIKKEADDLNPVSAWLFNCIASKHAKVMDNYPTFNCLAREKNDVEEAKKLSSILPVILKQNDFEDVYDKCWWYKLKQGVACYGVFWDGSKLNGLGDIKISKIDMLNLFWKGGIEDIQDSPNVFEIKAVDNDTLEKMYPELKGKLGYSPDIPRYANDNETDTNDMSLVVDWYYKIQMEDGSTVLHYCKYCDENILYSSEDDENYAERGFYDHGLYPYVVDVLYPEENTIAGFGYVDICKEPQTYIDKLDTYIQENAQQGAAPRYFYKGEENAINIEDFADVTKKLIRVNGNLDNIKPVDYKPLDSIYVSVKQEKIEELKETSGNRDVSNGGVTSGATSASAISAMQEAGGALDRDMIKASYRSYVKIINICIELIRQFYDVDRCFRITGENGKPDYVYYNNSGITMQPQAEQQPQLDDNGQPILDENGEPLMSEPNELGVEMGYTQPIFDVEVSAQKASPYAKLSQNDLAMQFYNSGFFNPQLVDQALACIEMMDFDGKDAVIDKISQNGTLYETVMQQQQQIAVMAEYIIQAGGQDLLMQLGLQSPMEQITPSGANVKQKQTNSLGGSLGMDNSLATQARVRAANTSTPT